ncbi:uncharacterized protein LOC129580709 [Paramacrobiotus metropolitanus]|uniref:uncharacterized protein LOC129580709 n=1 Tax=Paramacrobiotus metropolitanus TaxID=2943436 RepID=UPI0024464483|nr:uncharacterized protein LOC129580709 [Paramacrobiotus metropolitanus]
MYHRNVFIPFYLVIGLGVIENQALQCFVCTANLLLNKDCRSLSAARLIDCPDTSDHCNAIITDIDGQIIVNRGCSGNVEAWGYGSEECDIMTNDKLIDRAVAFYQCRGDGCNNLEPGQITTETKVVANNSNVNVPKFALTSNLKSEHIVGMENQISDSRAIVTNEEEKFMRRGKQANDDADQQDDETYGDNPRKKTRSTTKATTPTTTETTTTTTTTTEESTTTTKRPIFTTRPIITRPRRRNFTIFDRK